MALGGLSSRQCLQRPLLTESPGEKAHLDRSLNLSSIFQK